MDYQKAVADQLPAPRPPVVLMYHSMSSVFRRPVPGH